MHYRIYYTIYRGCRLWLKTIYEPYIVCERRTSAAYNQNQWRTTSHIYFPFTHISDGNNIFIYLSYKCFKIYMYNFISFLKNLFYYLFVLHNIQYKKCMYPLIIILQTKLFSISGNKNCNICSYINFH